MIWPGKWCSSPHVSLFFFSISQQFQTVIPHVCATSSDRNNYSEEWWWFKSTKMRISLVLGSLSHQCTLQNPVRLHELCMNCILFALWGRERVKKDGSVALYKCPVCALQKYAHCNMHVRIAITSKCQAGNFEVLPPAVNVHTRRSLKAQWQLQPLFP